MPNNFGNGCFAHAYPIDARALFNFTPRMAVLGVAAKHAHRVLYANVCGIFFCNFGMTFVPKFTKLQ